MEARSSRDLNTTARLAEDLHGETGNGDVCGLSWQATSVSHSKPHDHMFNSRTAQTLMLKFVAVHERKDNG
jgi:hypothetical protein